MASDGPGGTPGYGRRTTCGTGVGRGGREGRRPRPRLGHRRIRPYGRHGRVHRRRTAPGQPGRLLHPLRDLFAVLRAADLKTGRAWAVKENLCLLWAYQRHGWGKKHWRRWHFWATHSRLQPVIDVAKILKRHQADLLNYFTHRVTNATAESLNYRIQAIRVAARGYRNREHFKTAIYFHCGGLVLYPITYTHRKPGRAEKGNGRRVLIWLRQIGSGKVDRVHGVSRKRFDYR